MPYLKIKKELFLILGFLILLIACKAMTLTDVGRLHKGMTIEESTSILPIPPKYNIPIEMEDRTIQVQVYAYVLSSGNYESYYLLAFRNSQLHYWGYPHEFARSQDPIINEIGKKAVSLISEFDKVKGI